MLPFILINILVSAAVTLGVLLWWENRNSEPEQAEAVATLPIIAQATVELAPLQPGDAAAEPLVADAPAPEAVIHVVQSGDTLNAISARYEVSLEDIMLVNGLSNADLLSIGQQLTIPVGGIPEPTAVAEATEAIVAMPSPIPTEPPAAAAGESVITIREVIGPGVLTEEAVEIANNGADPQSLQGWQLVSPAGDVYTFGQAVVFGDGAGIKLHTRAGENGPLNLFWGMDAPVWQSGDTITLADSAGQTIATLTVP